MKCCLTCSHLKVCPIIILWIKLTESPIKACSFYCSEYQKEKEPKAEMRY